ncbi:MAG: FGGY-family carbohydrate kinase [bacterium]
MAEKDLILAIDCGTQSIKAMAFDVHGQMQGMVKVPFEPVFHSPKPGWAEQDPLYYWKSLCEATQKLFCEKGVEKHRIAGVSLTTQRATVVNVDFQGNPLRPAILWLDQRRTQGLKPIGGWWGLVFSLAGLKPTLAYIQREAEANWIQTHQPKIWEKTHKFLLLSGYLSFMLTGEYLDSVGCQVGYIPFDYKRLCWAKKWDWKWQLPITRDQLPELVDPGAIMGAITPRSSQQTGIPPGTPVIAAASDKACEVIGCGGLEPWVGCISYGTTATINVTHKKYLEPVPLIPAYPSAIPGYHCLEVQIFRGYWMVSWFKKEFGHPERLEAEQKHTEAETLLDRLLEQTAPGSMGLVLQPYWSPGIRFPGPEAKGCILGFGDVHTRGHLYRAILEGLAYALREGKERIEKKTKVPVSELRISGGGSQSRGALQITADVFNLPTYRAKSHEASGLGAAICAAVGLGFFNSYKEAIEAMTQVQELFEPNAGNSRLYDALYARIYKRIYSRLKPLYEEIREITGYPEV